METFQSDLNDYQNLIDQYNSLLSIKITDLENCNNSFTILINTYNRIISLGDIIRNKISALVNTTNQQINELRISTQNPDQGRINNLTNENLKLIEIYNNIQNPSIPSINCNICIERQITNSNDLSSLNQIFNNSGINNRTSEINQPSRLINLPQNINGQINQQQVPIINQQPRVSIPQVNTPQVNIPQVSTQVSIPQVSTQVSTPQVNIPQSINVQNQRETTPVSLNYINELIERVRQTGDIPNLRPGLTDSQRNSVLQILESTRTDANEAAIQNTTLIPNAQNIIPAQPNVPNIISTQPNGNNLISSGRVITEGFANINNNTNNIIMICVCTIIALIIAYIIYIYKKQNM